MNNGTVSFKKKSHNNFLNLTLSQILFIEILTLSDDNHIIDRYELYKKIGTKYHLPRDLVDVFLAKMEKSGTLIRIPKSRRVKIVLRDQYEKIK